MNSCTDFFHLNLMNNMISLYLCLIVTRSGLIRLHHLGSLSDSNRKGACGTGGKVESVQRGYPTKLRISLFWSWQLRRVHELACSRCEHWGQKRMKLRVSVERRIKRVKLICLYCPTLKLECSPSPNSPLCLQDHKEQLPIPAKWNHSPVWFKDF